MKRKITLSVVIPTLGRNIVSLKKILKANLKVVVIIDRNLTFKKKFINDYKKKIKNRNILVIYNKNKLGINQLRYLGALKTKSDYILFVDDDDDLNTDNLLVLKKKIKKINTDIIISKYIFKFKGKSFLISPIINLFGKYSPFVKTITPGGGTIFNKKIIHLFLKSNFSKFEDWCHGIRLIYVLKKKYYLNCKPFYLVNYKYKKEKNLLNTLKYRINYAKKFGFVPLFHSTISYVIFQIYIKILR